MPAGRGLGEGGLGAPRPESWGDLQAAATGSDPRAWPAVLIPSQPARVGPGRGLRLLHRLQSAFHSDPQEAPLPQLREDLLLALLLALGAAAALRAGEAGPRVHALLHVPRHALLQRQGGHLTRRASPRAPQDSREGAPTAAPRLCHPGGPSAGRRGFAASHLPAGPAAAGAAGARTPELQCLRPPPAGPSGLVQRPTEVSCSQRGDLGCQAWAWVGPPALLRCRLRLSCSGRPALPGRVMLTYRRGGTQSRRRASPVSWPNGERPGCPLSPGPCAHSPHPRSPQDLA